jgi:hypothetical protein
VLASGEEVRTAAPSTDLYPRMIRVRDD